MRRGLRYAPGVNDAESRAPALRFGTSGLRGLVRDMTDLEVFVNVRGFLAYVAESQRVEEVALAEDLRSRDPKSGLSSSPRIARAVAAAVRAAGARVRYLGRIPTPALAHAAMHLEARPMPGVMVTGSHIPADRNGVKFYRPDGEVLKTDEPGILAAVRRIRAEESARRVDAAPFDRRGMFRRPPEVPCEEPRGARAYVGRFVEPFAGRRPLSGLRLVLYQHSAVGRDLTREIFETLGAAVFCEGRTDDFVAVDTEDVTEADERRYGRLVARYRADALLSTDGDGDRPLVVDGRGRFVRGDALGALVAEHLGADFVAVPVSSSDAVDRHLARGGRARLVKTRIGSPYVIEALRTAVAGGARCAVGWEANGGFLLASEVSFGTGRLPPLLTRDAVLPMVAVLLAARAAGGALHDLVDRLPSRFTRAGLRDGIDPGRSRAILGLLGAGGVEGELSFHGTGEVPSDARRGELRACIQRYFTPARGYSAPAWVSYIDGVRIGFDNGDIAHLRPSGNAPQLRLYAVADTQARADEIVRDGLARSRGVLAELEEATGEAA